MLYLRTTVDELELPVAVAESPGELAEMLGTNTNVVSSSISHQRPGWFRLEDPDEWHSTNEGQLWRYREDSTVEYRN